MKLSSLCCVAAAAIFLSACGGSDDDAPPRGALVEAPSTVTTLSAAQIDAATSANGLQALSGAALCDVKVVGLNYFTAGAHNEQTNASAVMLIPTGGASCTAASPLVAYAKGTDFQKPRTLANPQDGETFLLIAMYAAQGYTVVATDYLGYAKSNYPYHPYLHADSEASSVIDSIRAARNAAAGVGANLSGKVMFNGYSQGGHSSMAAHIAAERDNAAEINVVAGAHMAGPYNLAGTISSPVAIAGYQFFVPFIITAWQKVYGNIYSDPNAVFQMPYATGIDTLLPSPTLDATGLVTSGKLPGINGETPAQARDELMQPAFLADLQNNPNAPIVLDAQKNTLLGWTPKAQTLMCGGAGDPTVPPSIHMNVAQADFTARGVTTVSSVDVDPQIQAAHGSVLSSSPATYFGNYHGTYEPPFCMAASRALFNALR
jgi:pimeloyl-ACP methyl ester carboxylesterase